MISGVGLRSNRRHAFPGKNLLNRARVKRIGCDLRWLSMDVKASKMRPGFRVLTDMTDLESMDHAGAPYIGSVMNLCVTRQVEHVVRVIPDPHKDIGLNTMSYFHFA
jgi:hypothetical protein